MLVINCAYTIYYYTIYTLHCVLQALIVHDCSRRGCSEARSGRKGNGLAVGGGRWFDRSGAKRAEKKFSKGCDLARTFVCGVGGHVCNGQYPIRTF